MANEMQEASSETEMPVPTELPTPTSPVAPIPPQRVPTKDRVDLSESPQSPMPIRERQRSQRPTSPTSSESPTTKRFRILADPCLHVKRADADKECLLSDAQSPRLHVKRSDADDGHSLRPPLPYPTKGPCNRGIADIATEASLTRNARSAAVPKVWRGVQLEISQAADPIWFASAPPWGWVPADQPPLLIPAGIRRRSAKRARPRPPLPLRSRSSRRSARRAQTRSPSVVPEPQPSLSKTHTASQNAHSRRSAKRAA